MAAYTPTVWINNQAPAMTAANLNKLTDELESQAAAQAVSHTLPNWTDGAAPAITDAAPWNEIERVIQSVAQSLSLTYTRDTWETGWTPARNAARLNRMEQQLVVNRNAIDAIVTPPGFASPLGYLSNQSYFPGTRLEDYSVITSQGPAPAAFRGVNLQYRTAITCTGTTNISEAECISNDWYLRDAAGPLRNTQFGNVILADPGIPAYRQRWAEATLQNLAAHGSDGFWADDAAPTLVFMAGRRSSNYPTDAAYASALLGFYQYQKSYFNSRSLKTGYNALITLDDSGSLFNAWCLQVGQGGSAADVMTAEYWMSRGGAYIRSAGSNWDQNWNQWRIPHQTCNTYGMGFFPLDEWIDNTYKAFTLGSFMLDWNGNPMSAHIFRRGPDLEEWTTAYAQAVALGLPTAAAVHQGNNIWTRQFQHGSLSVNANSGQQAATFTVV